MRSAALFLLAGLAAQAQTILTKVPGTAFDAGAGPYGAITGDFNRDGIPDLAYADYGSSSVTILLGSRTGAFTPSPGSPFRAGAETLALVSADFNGDGNLDIATLNSLSGSATLGSGSIVVLLGDGRGGFTLASGPPAITYGNPVNLVTADFNGDGIVDLLTGTSDGFQVLFGNGKGGFASAQGSTFPMATSWVVAGDFNRDGHMDVARYSDTRHSVAVYFGDGKGQFRNGPETMLSANSKFGAVLVGDWNLDGRLDLLINTSSPGIDVLLGDGAGGFQLRTTLPNAPYGTLQPISIADFDGDGKPDLAVSYASVIKVLLGDGTGDFVPAQTLDSKSYLGITVAVDWNGDGKPDLVSSTGTLWSNSLQTIPVTPNALQLNSAVGQASPRAVPITVGAVAGLTVRSDQNWVRLVNSLLTVDSSALAPGTYQATLRLSAPGYFGASIRVNLNVAAPSGAVSLSSTEPNVIALGDFNGDGKPDLLTRDGQVLTVRLNDGSGKFAPGGKSVPAVEPGTTAIADFNGDGFLDVAVLGATGITLYPGDGTGALQSGRLSAAGYSGGPLIVADFNGDGFPDIAAASFSQLPIRVFLGNGHGGFSEVANPVSSLRRQPIVLISGDFNNDGNPDLAFSEIAGENVYVLLGNGNGTFQLTQTINFGGASLPGQIALGDWNGDGNLDLAVVNHGYIYDSLVTVLLGDGKGQFIKSANIRFPQPQVLGSVVAGDLDGDGNLDLIVGLRDGTTSIMRGDGAGGFAATPGGPVAAVGSSTLVTDLNGDGRTDLVFNGLPSAAVYLGGLAGVTVMLAQDPPNPFNIGQTVTLIASVAAQPGAFRALPTGTVSLIDSPSAPVTAPFLNGGARFVTRYISGTHSFLAVYNGDTFFAPGTSSLKVVETGSPAALTSVGDGLPLRALVSDANGNAVMGVGVVFSAPLFGPSGFFGSDTRAVVVTNAQGIAAAPDLTSNGLAGAFSIAATVSGYPVPPILFALRN